MNLKYIKSIFPLLTISLCLSLGSCVNDLDVTPIDPNSVTAFNQEAVFTKIYASLSLTGQQGPAGNSDISGLDEGTYGFLRQMWNFQEMPTDEAVCAWGDTGIPELNFITWNSSTAFISGFYQKLMIGVTLCNRFLELTTDETDDASLKQRAETRFIRALYYYYLMDLFGNPSFTTTVSTEAPQQIKRADLFAFLETELQECVTDMYDPQTAPYGRADKAAAWLLLSRLYLNAEVYTGTAHWSDAAEYSYKVITSGYTLCPDYEQLFMADNSGANDPYGSPSTVNKATDEIILPILTDGVDTKSYSNMQFIIASTHTADMPGWGSTAGWGGNRARPNLVDKFTTTNDARYLFFSTDRTKDISNTQTFKEGYSVTKFSNIRADGGAVHDVEYVDTDFPLLRAAEAYLTYAEAVVRGGTAQAMTALDAINEVRHRAGLVNLQSLTSADQVLDEKAREFYFEGQRRTDLIRFGYFTSSSYVWQWKGGVQAGNGVASTYNLYPIPSADLSANANLVQNPGY
ncbi:RagB/SusD family nutrient uptake outer membrane protein [uncultured Bacteroides sp.]|uniref:RagB/SusD family nutrient uptake outer membrane protein n=1 Tax=uncultured Bacteroides sp. TaxID=162156 RepID=UPI002AA81728|nr:RagB/SusD family nutrient uptake outer membrane protein [uncultured Bacteroides sp.]